MNLILISILLAAILGLVVWRLRQKREPEPIFLPTGECIRAVRERQQKRAKQRRATRRLGGR